MGTFPGFVGPSYVSQSSLVDAEQCINFYPEATESAGAVVRYALYPTPGLTRFSTVPQTPIRGMFAQDGRVFVVGGAQFNEVVSTGVSTEIEGMASDANQATMCSSGDGGQEIFITSGDHGYIFNLFTSVFTHVLSGATMGGYMDGRFLALDSTLSKLNISEVYDGLTWDPTQFAQRTSGADKWIAMLVRRPDIWLFGSQTTDVWYNAGISPFPFAPRQDISIQSGIAAPFSAAVLDNAPTWLAQTADGAGIVLQAAGYTPKRISTHAVEWAIQGYATISDAIGWTYQDQGHSFYVLTFPTAGTTWVFDAATALWHQRGFWNATTAQYDAWRPQSHSYAFGQHLVGDRATGAIYTMNALTATEADGSGIRRVRRAPHVSDAGEMLFHSGFQIDLEVGLGVTTGQGSDPQVMLRWSNDGGKTYGNEHWTTAGALGKYQTRAQWNRLGRARDRVYEMVVSDPIPWRVTRALLEVDA